MRDKTFESNLPSDKKFGVFFSIIFAVGGIYVFSQGQPLWALALSALSVLLAVIVIVKSSILLPFNRLWARLGYLLGTVVSPVVLGLIFFAIVTPTGLVLRFFGRDELGLKIVDAKTFWKLRGREIPQTDFTKQF